MSNTRVDPLIVICRQCKAARHQPCTYVHPKEWSPESQHRFFNHTTVQKQQEILARAYTPTQIPHQSRFADARKYLESVHEQPPIFTWDFIEPDLTTVHEIVMNSETFYPQSYINKVLVEARAEWEKNNICAHDDAEGAERYRVGYRTGYEDGVARGKKVAINLIASGSEDE